VAQQATRPVYPEFPSGRHERHCAVSSVLDTV